MDFLEKLVSKTNESKNITKTACLIIFMLLSFMLGTFYIKNISPLTLPDAAMHLENSVSLAEGNLFLTSNYVSLPKQYSYNYKTKYTSNKPVSPLEKFTVSNLLISLILSNSSTVGDDDWTSRISQLPKATGNINTYVRRQYPSINWLPQAIGFSIAQLKKSSLLDSFIAMRLANLIFYMIVSGLSIYLLPRGKIFGSLLLLNPYTIFMASSISGDVFTIASVSLFIAYVFCLCVPGKEISRKQIIFLISLGILLFMTKVAYVPVLLLIFAIPKERMSVKLKLRYFSLIAVSGAILYGIWSRFFATVGNPKNFSPSENLSNILKHPWQSLMSVISNSLQPKEITTYLGKIFTGSVDFIHLELLYPVLICLIISLSWLILSVFYFRNKNNWKLFIFALVAAFGSISITNAALLITWTATYKYGFSHISGFQGRYYLPLILLLLVPWISYLKEKSSD